MFLRFINDNEIYKKRKKNIYGGESGIRTHGPRKRTSVFKTDAFDHSAISPPYNGAPRRSRTSNPQIRSLILYPIELWAQKFQILVPRAGLEPAQCRHRGILNPVRLPIPPPRLLFKDDKRIKKK